MIGQTNFKEEVGNFESDPGWMTKRELCRRWKVCAKTIERWVSQGKLIAHHFGKSVRFALKDVVAFENTTGVHHV
jgi:excisionase family DNA binding protein